MALGDLRSSLSEAHWGLHTASFSPTQAEPSMQSRVGGYCTFDALLAAEGAVSQINSNEVVSHSAYVI